MKIQPLFAATAAACLVLSLSACGSEEDTSGGDGAGDNADAGADDSGDDGGSTDDGDSAEVDTAALNLVSEGTLTVCSDVPYPPFEDFDESAESGFSGFDIDIVSYVADGLGVELAVKDSAFDGLQSGLSLNAGECDLVASAMTITEDRAKNLAFSDGYYDSLQSLLVPSDSDIAAIADLEGKRVAVQQGTTGEAYAKENATGAELVAFPSNAEIYQALLAGQVDAALQDLPVNVDNAKKGDFTIVEEYDTDETYGLAIKKDNDALVEAVNAQLTELRDSGEYDTLYDQYFSEDAASDDAESTSR
ncbi:transporter substrate-binding domain-containing protein [Ornithinimicrobium faecis]|uniref:Transporter substrate-binding domain-containing protein n=1 Tax=Ornithinimicrobium faecis TaxID=2934158 RepID=A0ABY4YZT6_9MICO|nr:transporter substrate-binding domain-containing protein [Ornithinimicrobium sp. HY1793]USQ81960.1 transporter substrate-binding domain-containing protein [Ornithinimicrobium sp. HY1793]